MGNTERKLAYFARRREKAETFKAFVIAETQKLKAGESIGLPPVSELAAKFDYSIDTIYHYLAKTRAVEERRSFEATKVHERLIPSSELAWIIGLLSGGGHVGSKRIAYTSINGGLIGKFQSMGERLFGVNAHIKHAGTFKSGHENIKVSFCNSAVSEVLGNLNSNLWPTAILERHHWILDQQSHLLSFIEGFFEARGHSRIGKDSEIHFNITHQSAVNFLAELLARLGINSTLVRNKRLQSGIGGVAIVKMADIRNFAKQIHSVVPQQEKKLEELRNLWPRPTSLPVYSEDQMTEEWARLLAIFKHSPTSYKLRKLYKQGETPFSPELLAQRFSKSNSFREARENLNRIIQECGVALEK